MKRINILLILVALVVLSACSNKLSETPTPVGNGDVLGHLTIHVDVVNGLSTATFTPNANVSSQALEDITTQYTSNDFVGIHSENREFGGKTYINVSYKFPNKLADAKEIILVAVHNDNTIGTTPFSNLLDYADQPYMVIPDSLQLDNSITQADGSISAQNSFLSTLDNTGLGGNGDTALNQGFQAWNSGFTSKTIAGNAEAKVVFSSSFNGSIQAQEGPQAFNLNFIVTAQDPQTVSPSELFFSEYIEGSSNNKALEIFNGTGADVNLSTYSVQLFNNGASSATSTFALSGILANNDVYVIANASANTAIKNVADTTMGNVTSYNGDDAIALLKDGTIIDVIGQIGFDPGSEWGTGDTSTGENTLRRKPNVCGGDADGTDAFDPSTEWNGFPQNNSDDLGQHTVTCS